MEIVLCSLWREAVREVQPQCLHVCAAVIAPDAVGAHLRGEQEDVSVCKKDAAERI